MTDYNFEQGQRVHVEYDAPWWGPSRRYNAGAVRGAAGTICTVPAGAKITPIVNEGDVINTVEEAELLPDGAVLLPFDNALRVIEKRDGKWTTTGLFATTTNVHQYLPAIYAQRKMATKPPHPPHVDDDDPDDL